MVRALVVGVGDFSEPYVSEDDQADRISAFEPLPAVRNAVRALAFAMDRAGAVTGDPLLECTRAEFVRVWDELRRHAGPGEPLVVHFAGHSTQPTAGGALYLAAAGGEPRDDRLDDTCLSVEVLLRTARNSGRQVLFLLDVCQAGQAVVQQQLADLAARHQQDGQRNVWVIGACAADAITYGARFTTATAEILHRLAEGDLDISPYQEYVPVATLAQAVDRHLAATDRSAQRPSQNLVHTPHVHADPPPQPFFRNPAHRADLYGGLLTGMNPRLREFALTCSPGLDPLHFATRAAGQPTATDILFSGRTSQLRQIEAWTAGNGEHSDRMFVVTGGPGSGKSALLGITTCLLHPELEEFGDRVARFVQHFQPRDPDVVLAVHARQLTLQQIADSLHHQLHRQRNITHTPEGSHSSAGFNAHEQQSIGHLIEILKEARPTVLIVDALDEAENPAAVVDELLLPLTATTPGCRILVGTRPWWDTLPTLHNYLTEHPDALLNLDPATEDDRRILADDLNTYLKKVLPRRYPTSETRRIAEQLATYSDHGAFLVAYLYADHLNTTPVQPTSVTPPCSVTEVFDLHLDSLAATEPWIRPVLTVLGHARGQGMPLDLIHAAALAHQPPAPGRPAPQLADTRRALAKAAFYLRTTPDTDQRLLYRYFHHALNEHTRNRTDPATLHHTLISTVPTSSLETPDWQRAHAYLRRHAADHAVIAGRHALDELLTDPGFLVHADPDHLVVHLHRAHSEQARLNAHVYRTTTAHDPRRHRLEARRDLLALDAAGWQQPDFATTVMHTSSVIRPAQLIPRWATRRTHPARLHTLVGHTGWLGAVAVVTGPKGPLAMTVGDDGIAMVWDLITGRRLHTLEGHTGPVRSVAMAAGPEGPLAITTSEDETAMVWDLITGRHLHTLESHTSPVRSVAMAAGPEGPLAITTSEDETAMVWDLITGRHLHTLESHTSLVKAATGPAGPLAITSDQGGTIIVWDLITGRRLHTLEGHTGWVTSVAVAAGPNGPLTITTSQDGTAMVWDLITGQRLHTLEGHADWVTSVAVAVVAGPEGPLAMTVGDDGIAMVWDLITGRRLHTLESHTGWASSVAVAAGPNGPLAITTSDDGTAMVWDLITGRRLHTLEGHTGRVSSVAVAAGPNGPLAITTSQDGTAIVWDLITSALLHTRKGHTGRVSSVAMAAGPNGPLAITTSQDGTAIVWDLITGRRLHTLEGHTDLVRAVAVAAGPKGPLAITTSDDGTAMVWDLITGRRLHTLEGHTGWVSAVAVAAGPEGPLAMTISDDGTAIVWDLITGWPLHTLEGHRNPVGEVAVAAGPKGPLAITASDDGTAIVWDLITGRRLHTLEGHTGWVSAVGVAAGPEGPLAITTSNDRTAIVWDLITGRRLHTLEGHTDLVRAVAVAAGPEGPLAITTSNDRTAIVWDLITGRHLHTLEGHTDLVRAVAVAAGPEGPLAITTSNDRTAIVWDLITGGAIHRCHLPYGAESAAACGAGFLVAYGSEVAYFEWSHTRP